MSGAAARLVFERVHCWSGRGVLGCLCVILHGGPSSHVIECSLCSSDLLVVLLSHLLVLQPVSHLRVRLTDPNASGTRVLALGGIELYGLLTFKRPGSANASAAANAATTNATVASGESALVHKHAASRLIRWNAMAVV